MQENNPKQLKSIKVITVLGTRPEIIKLSRILPLLDQFTSHKVVHTGQNYDPNLNARFWDELRLRQPDYFLECSTNSLGEFIADSMIKFEMILKNEVPDVVVVLGDTNSALCTYIARRMGIKIVHLEAGNRCFDPTVPEETNRKILDHFSDVNLVYTEHARRNLLSEGIHASKVYVMGSPMNEVLHFYKNDITSSDILNMNSLKPKDYFLVSLHREESVDNPVHLRQVLIGLLEVSKYFGKRILFSTHPRTQKRIEQMSYETVDFGHIEFHEPFGFFDYISLQVNAFAVLSDSGTLSEESAILGFPAVIVRNHTERPEAQDVGSVVLAGYNADTIINAIKIVTQKHELGISASIPSEYTIHDTSWRVLQHVIGIQSV